MLRTVSFTDHRVWRFIETYYEGRIRKEMLDGAQYTIVKCSACGLLFQREILNESNMNLLYEEWISPEHSINKKREAELTFFHAYAVEVEGICAMIPKKPSAVSVLDYGMGWGYWAVMAKAFGFNVAGVELSGARTEFATRSGIRVIRDTPQEKSGSFDYIYANQVFEHLPTPAEALRELARLLAPGGVIHVQVPNGRAMERTVQYPAWKAEKDALHPLEHINCFNRRSLTALAGEASLVLGRPPFRPDFSGLKAMARSHARYLYDLVAGTRVYLVRSAAAR